MRGWCGGKTNEAKGWGVGAEGTTRIMVATEKNGEEMEGGEGVERLRK